MSSVVHQYEAVEWDSYGLLRNPSNAIQVGK